MIEVGQLLRRGGYRIKVLNTINFSKSMRYNPFAYLHSEKDILKLVNTIIANTKGDGEKSAEDFWVKSERLFYTALIGYIWYEAPENEKNFTTLLEMINASEAREDDAEFQSPVTACAPLCGLADARRVTSRSPSQTKLCPKRVAGVRHPAKSAQPKVAGEPGGEKSAG